MANSRKTPRDARGHAGSDVATPGDTPSQRTSAARALRGALPSALLVVFLLGLLLVFRERADHPLGVRSDSWTEATILVSARNVAVNGWAKYRGASPQQVDRPPFKSDPFLYYTRSQLGTYYANWLLYGWGATSPAALRWLPTLSSLASLMLWYLVLRRFVDRWTALVTIVIMGTAYGFLDYADNLYHGYMNGCVAATALCFVAAVESSGRRRHTLMAATWALLCLNCFLSWEWILFSLVFIWGYALLFDIPFRRRWLVLFVLAPILAIGILSVTREASLGAQGAGGMIDDLLRRTIRLTDTPDTPPTVTLATYPLHVATRFEQFYGIGLGPVCLLALAWGVVCGSLRGSIRRAAPAFRLVILLLACGVSWWCVMLQHTAVHQHTMRNALAFYALVLGLTVAGGIRLSLDSGRRWWVRVPAGLVVPLVLWVHGARSYENFRLHADPTFQVPNHWDEGWGESVTFTDVAAKLPRDAIVLTNNNRLPLLRYWTDLPVYPGTLSVWPFSRGKQLPNARFRIELTINHLRDLYGEHLPRVVYVYWFFRPPDVAYARDPVLWQLMDGTWKQPPTAARVAQWGSLYAQMVSTGRGARYPMIAEGGTWLCFDISTMFDNLPNDFRRLGPPTRAEFGLIG